MKLETSRFGVIELEENEIVTFPSGLPGFEHLRSFAVIKPEGDIPLAFMQSVDDGGIAFIVANPFLFFPDYDFILDEAVEAELKIRSEEDVMVWSIVTVKDSLEDATLNLLAPVIFNMNERIGKQIILHGTPYRTKHPIYQKGA